MSSHGAAAPHSVAPGASASPTNARATASHSSARAAASRANGARSRGPRTAEGKARASQNARKHGLCAKKFLLLPDDSRAQFAALEAALLDDLSPQGALQTLLAHRLIAAAWRLFRADRLELELFRTHDALEGGLGRALVKDGRDAKVFPTLVRYRGAAMAELFRTLKALEAVQRDAADEAEPFRILGALEAVPTEAAAKTDAAKTDVERTPGLAVVPPPAPKGAMLCADVDALRPNATRKPTRAGHKWTPKRHL